MSLAVIGEKWNRKFRVACDSVQHLSSKTPRRLSCPERVYAGIKRNDLTQSDIRAKQPFTKNKLKKMNGLRYRKIRNIEELEAVRAGTQPRTSTTQSIVWRRGWAYKIKK